jgi:hypothetical protein
MSRLAFATFLILLDDYDDLHEEVKNLNYELDSIKEQGSRKEYKAHKKNIKDVGIKLTKIKEKINNQWDSFTEFVDDIILCSEENDFYILVQVVGAKNKLSKINA